MVRSTPRRTKTCRELPHYSETPDRGSARKYNPGICTGIKKSAVYGEPDIAHVSTSYVEKHNQTMRQHMKRFARLTAAHSKKIKNYAHMCALYTVWYNFARINSGEGVARYGHWLRDAALGYC